MVVQLGVCEAERTARGGAREGVHSAAPHNASRELVPIVQITKGRVTFYRSSLPLEHVHLHVPTALY